MKKIFHVQATLEIDMIVLADDEAQAVKVGYDDWLEEVKNAGLEPEGMCASEVTSRKQLAWAGDLACTVPYGQKGLYEHGCFSPQREVGEYLDELGVKE